MEKKYINENRYKKNSNSINRLSRRNINIKEKIKEQDKKNVAVVNVSKNKKRENEVKQRKTQSIRTGKVVNILICVLLLIIASILSRAILKDENEPFIPIFSSKVQENNDEIRIGIITEEDITSSTTLNIVGMELNSYVYDMLLNIDKEYNIDYKVLSDVEKISNKEYHININQSYGITSNRLKEILESYMKKNSKLYVKTFNIKEIEILDNFKLKILLKQEDPYYMYNLRLPINESRISKYTITNTTKSYIEFTRKEETDKSLPYKIRLTTYPDLYRVIDAYKQQQIDCFITSQQSFRNILGKYEYNIKEYRNGETLFLFGSNKSNLFARKEVRQAIAYSLDRDGIIKDIFGGNATKIDLPYIYDEVKYKYDIYAAENILLSNGYVKSNSIYRKRENGKTISLNLELIVNESDEIKIKVAEEIKKNLNSIGIGVYINKLSEKNMIKKVNSGEYDILLASINLNDNPSIDFVENHININSIISEQLNKIEKSSIQDMAKNITELQIILSNEIACIGIYANSTYMILNKNILGFEDISYMNIFTNILSSE